MEMEEEQEMSSLRGRRKKSIAGCFTATPQHQHRRRSSFDAIFSSSPRISSPSTWIKSKSITTDSDLKPKFKCRNFISRITRHRRHSSADFSYDPLSYALNFHDDDDHHPMNFSTRLPTSPAPTRIQPTTTPFDHHNLPRTPPIPTSPDQEFVNPKIEAVTDDLRRGFEALSLNMKRTEEPPANLIIGSQTTNNTELSSSSSPRAASVRRSLDPDQDPMSPVGMSSNRNVLVQLC